MTDKITVADPGFSWDWWLWSAGGIAVVFAVALVVYLFSFAASSRSQTEQLRRIARIIGLVALIAVPSAAASCAVISSVTRTTQIEEERDRQIEALGYLNLDEESEYYQYTAVKDNEYVRLVMIEYPTLTWHVVVLDMSVDPE